MCTSAMCPRSGRIHKESFTMCSRHLRVHIVTLQMCPRRPRVHIVTLQMCPRHLRVHIVTSKCGLVTYEYTLQGTRCMLVNRAAISALDSTCGFARGVSFLSHSPSLTTPSYEDFPSPFSPSQRADCPRHRTAHTETSLLHPRLYARLSRPTLCRHPHHTTRAKYRRTLRSALLSSGTNQPRSTLRSTRFTRTIAPRRSTLGHCCGL